jgi:hypothetical protein
VALPVGKHLALIARISSDTLDVGHYVKR